MYIVLGALQLMSIHHRLLKNVRTAPLTLHWMLTGGVPPVQLTEHCIRLPPELQPTNTLPMTGPRHVTLIDPSNFSPPGGAGGDSQAS
jgi:hypothetical protein